MQDVGLLFCSNMATSIAAIGLAAGVDIAVVMGTALTWLAISTVFVGICTCLVGHYRLATLVSVKIHVSTVSDPWRAAWRLRICLRVLWLTVMAPHLCWHAGAIHAASGGWGMCVQDAEQYSRLLLQPIGGWHRHSNRNH